MSDQTHKKAALITGGAQRIGKSIAQQLAQSGFDIALHYNKSKKDAEQAVNEFKDAGYICEAFQADLTNEADTKTLFEKVHKHYPHLNLLVNNASVFKKSSIQKLDTDQLHEDFLIHVYAPYILISEFSRLIQKGEIINILDTHISHTQSSYMTYLLAKKSLANLTQMAAIELAPQIRVNAIAPGLILPPGNKSEDYLDRLAADIPLQRKGKVEDVSAAVEFFLENNYLTGQILHVDGGEHLI